MREFKSVSASQISNYRDCARKWWYQSILGLQTPQNASAALGEAVHAQLEAYLNDGDYPDTAKTAGRIAEAGLNLLPAPGTVFTEVPMHGTDRNKKEPGADDVPLPGAMPRLFVAGMPVNGYIDVLDVSADSPVVLDHKCLPASAVVHTDTGPRRVGDLAAGWTCAAWTGTDIVAAPALAPVDGGEQEVFRVELKNGMVGRYGYSHPILTRRGWVDADGLILGDEVAVALDLPDTRDIPVPDALLKVAAMLLCDGSLRSESLTYTKTGAAREEYMRLLGELGVPCAQRGLDRPGRAPYVQVGANSPLRWMLAGIGLSFVNSPERRVPAALMGMSRRQVGVFLGGIWAGDGAAYIVNEKGRKKPVITFANRSRAFCEDVRDLLLRLGLAATFTETSISYKGERRPYYAATVVGKRSKIAFLKMALRGEIALGDRCSGRKTRAGNTPPTLEEVLAAAETAPAHPMGQSPVRLDGPIWWVGVSNIVREGKEPCFDIEVPNHHTFVAEGVVTHNTTGDLKWAKTEADLREDVQMVLYGSYALDVVASMGVQADTVTAGHIVYLTKGAPLAKATKVTLTRDHLALERKKIAETVEEMKVSAKARTPDAVTGEPSSCSKFGGCHFKDKCAALGALSNIEIPSFIRNATPVPTPVHANPQQESPTMSNVDPLAALAALRAKKAAAAAAAPVEAPVTPAAPAEVPAASAAVAAPATVTGKSAEVLAKYGIKNAAATATPTAPSIVPSDTPPQSRPSFATPAATPAPAPAVEAVEDSEAKATRKPKNYQTKLTALNWTEAQISRMNAEAMRAAIDGNLDGRAYSVTPTGSIHIPGEGRLDTSTVPWKDDGFESEEEAKQFYATFPEEAPKAAPVAAPAEKVPAAVAAPVAPAAPTLVLYIDCSPEKGRERDYVLLEDFIQPMLPLVTEAYNRGCKKDDEKVPFYSLIPYARGPGFVAALVMQQPPTGVIVANTRFPATNAVLEVLIPMADVVVRGTR